MFDKLGSTEVNTLNQHKNSRYIFEAKQPGFMLPSAAPKFSIKVSWC